MVQGAIDLSDVLTSIFDAFTNYVIAPIIGGLDAIDDHVLHPFAESAVGGAVLPFLPYALGITVLAGVITEGEGGGCVLLVLPVAYLIYFAFHFGLVRF